MYKKLALLFVVTIFMTVSAVAQCSAPNTSGTLRICFPSNGSSIIGGTTFEMSANTGNAAIDKVLVYDNGVKVDQLGFLPSKLIEGAIHDGYHNVTINAWDTNGHLYQAKTSFTKIGGFDPGPCKSSTTGVSLCSAKEGGLEPNVSVPISFAVKTVAPTTAWKLYVDGTYVRHSDASTLKSIYTPLGMGAGHHSATVVAWDTTGKVYKTSHSFTAFHQRSCNPDTDECSAGIVTYSPDTFGPWQAIDTDQSFPLHAEVVGNSAAMQKMSVTLDGVVIAQGQGPGISTTVNAAKGSHTIMVQAMDTAGKLYATYGTVNVQ
jgi:hypothetical protein